MDPIRRKSSSDIRPADNATPKTPASAPSAKFAVTAGAPAGATTQPAPLRPNFQRMSARIQQGSSQGKSRDQILNDLVDSELQHAYGDKVSPNMRQSVVDQFASDPQLSDLFNQLMNHAGRSSAA